MRILGLVLLCACSTSVELPDAGDDLGSSAWSGERRAAVDDGEPVDPPTEGFQLPFPCGQVWLGQTRTNHSPMLSIDFNRTDDEGDDVVAAEAGVVTRVENLGSESYGRWIELRHAGGYRTRYAHLASQSVQVGQDLVRGQRIGTVGNTGGSTGAHLHYEVRENGIVVKAVFDDEVSSYYGTRSYTSDNACLVP